MCSKNTVLEHVPDFGAQSDENGPLSRKCQHFLQIHREWKFMAIRGSKFANTCPNSLVFIAFIHISGSFWDASDV